jgi:biotin transporter BioY
MLDFITIGLAVILGSCYLASFILISKFVGSSDAWNKIQDQTKSIWITSLFGSIFIFVSAFIYFRMNNNYEKMMYFIFTMAFLAMGLSFSALGVALIHKN